MPKAGTPAASTAAPQPPSTSQNVPKNSAMSLLEISIGFSSISFRPNRASRWESYTQGCYAGTYRGAKRMAKITGFGGIFFKARDPKALAAWYRDTLGLAIEEYGAALLRYDAPGHPEFVVWNPFAEDTKYFAPSTREFMINFAVDDLDAMVAALEAKGVTVL